MRRKYLSLLVAACIATGSASLAFAAPKTVAPPVASTIHVEGADINSQDVASIVRMLNELITASNRHDIQGVLKHYSSQFSSGDSLSLQDLRNLIQETWALFPNIQYDSQIMEIRLNGNWATVESIDTASGLAKMDPVLTDKTGKMKSRSRGLLYLHKTGKTWEIMSDYTLYEKATIVYGPYEAVDITLATPEQVFADELYTAKINVGVPPGSIAFATISKEPLSYPQTQAKDKFRTLSSDNSDLERIFKANNTNNNEVVTATVGLTEIGQDGSERPTIDLKGILTVIKRVNVIPKSTKTARGGEPIMTTSADGRIIVDPAAPSIDDAEESEITSPEEEQQEEIPVPEE